jgi:plasmid maintenance system antidote protein VapI
MLLGTDAHPTQFPQLSDKVVQEHQTLEALPEETPVQIEQKQKSLETFYQSHMPDMLQKSWAMYRRLQRKLQECQASEGYRETEKKIGSDKNPFRVWVELQLARSHYPDGKCQEKFKQQMNLTQKEFVSALRAQMDELSQLIQEKRITELNARTTPKLLRMMGEVWERLEISQEGQEMWNSLSAIYEQIPPDDKPSSASRSGEEDVQMSYYRQHLANYLKKFKQWMYVREYDLAQQGLEILWESLHSMDSINPEDDLVQTVRNRLKEVQAVKTLFSIANEAAKDSIGLHQTFSLKNGTMFSGRVVNYMLGCFDVYTSPDTKMQIPLKDLQAQDVVNFALSYRKNRYIYEYAGLFYFYERRFDLAQQAFASALEEGGENQIIQTYLQKIQEEMRAKRSKPELPFEPSKAFGEK